MAEEEDQGREIPALMRAGKNVAKWQVLISPI